MVINIRKKRSFIRKKKKSRNRNRSIMKTMDMITSRKNKMKTMNITKGMVMIMNKSIMKTIPTQNKSTTQTIKNTLNRKNNPLATQSTMRKSRNRNTTKEMATTTSRKILPIKNTPRNLKNFTKSKSNTRRISKKKMKTRRKHHRKYLRKYLSNNSTTRRSPLAREAPLSLRTASLLPPSPCSMWT
jgi:sensor c-di-GMP phosphodiesterase-like protein